MAETGENYTAAARAIETAAAQDTAGAAPHIDPQLLAPYPDETIRPANADDRWRAVTVDELGWRVLPANATLAQRARAESIWRPVTASRPCRCSGSCWHGERCINGDDGIASCPGRLVHLDRLAASLLSVFGWYDFYQCDTCGDEHEASVDLPEVPWGETIENGARQFEGVRRVTFYDAEPGYCDECGADSSYQCSCKDVYCDECGADSHYRCSCYDYAQ